MRVRTYLTRGYATLRRSELPPTFTRGLTHSARAHNKLYAWTGKDNTRALVRPQSLYILLPIKQGPVFLLNSRQGYVCCSPDLSSGQSIFQSYGRFFAEFLNEVSPIDLGALTPAHLCRFAVRSPLDMTL